MEEQHFTAADAGAGALGPAYTIPQSAVQNSQAAGDEQLEEARARRDAGANWLLWVAFATAFNGVLAIAGAQIALPTGLMGCFMASVVARKILGAVWSARAIGLGLGVVGSAGLAGLGSQARKGKQWAFNAGVLWLAADALIILYLAVKSGKMIIYPTLQLCVVYGAWIGARANKEWLRLNAASAAQANTPWS